MDVCTTVLVVVGQQHGGYFLESRRVPYLVVCLRFLAKRPFLLSCLVVAGFCEILRLLS